jgi:hypothetical protein
MSKRSSPIAIDFATASLDELDQYGMETLIFGSPEISSILRGHLLIERVIEGLIARVLSKPKKLFDSHRLTFELKVDLADAMGLLPASHVSAAKALNSIRNAYAHREDHAITVDELNSLKIKWEPIQKKAYAAASKKGPVEAVRIAVIFLNWSFLRLLHPV